MDQLCRRNGLADPLSAIVWRSLAMLATVLAASWNYGVMVLCSVTSGGTRRFGIRTRLGAKKGTLLDYIGAAMGLALLD